MSENLKHSPEGLIEAFEHHLVYEVNMLRATNVCLSTPVEAFGRVVVNALIESFCVHARNLIDFFDQSSETPGKAQHNYLGAKHFTTGYVPWAEGIPSNDLISRLNKQISHLTYGRTAKDEEKIGDKQRSKLLEILEVELKQFRDCLKDPYAQRWPFNDGDESTLFLRNFQTGLPNVAVGSPEAASSSITTSATSTCTFVGHHKPNS